MPCSSCSPPARSRPPRRRRLDTAAELTRGTVFMTVASQRFEVDSNSFEEPRDRYVTSVWLPHLGPTTRTLGLTVQSPACGMAPPCRSTGAHGPRWSVPGRWAGRGDGERRGGVVAGVAVVAGAALVNPDPAQEEESPELAAEPVDPDTVVVEDWRFEQQDEGGERC